MGAWGKVKVHLYLRGPAVLCLDEYPEELTDGNLFAEYLPAIALHGGEILVEANNPALKEIHSEYAYREMPDDELLRRLATMKYSLEL